MECPSCGKELTQMTAGAVQLDVCGAGCGGVWFDEKELLSLDERSEFATHPVLELAKRCAAVRVDSTKPKDCPKCPGETLVRQIFDVKNEIEIDQCWNCAGIWLDTGELNRVRDQYVNMAERSAAVNSHVEAQLKETKDQLTQATKDQIARYNEQTKSRFHAGLYFYKRLLGLEDSDLEV